MSDLPNGTSARIHADYSLAEMEDAVREVVTRIRGAKRLFPRDRAILNRRLAGVVGHCESLRVWLDAGAPE